MAQDSQSISDFFKLRLLVHVHIFYPQLYPELKTCLENLKGLNFDLYVTFVEDHPEIEADIRSFKSDAEIIKCPNRGYDIAPFVDVLNRVDLSNYDLVVKLHTKRDVLFSYMINGHDLSGVKWRERLLSFIRDKDSFTKCLQAFRNDPSIGLIGSHVLVATIKDSNPDPDLSYLFLAASKMLKKTGLDPQPRKSCDHLAGTMFIARSKVLMPLKSLGLTYEDFSVADRSTIQDMAHTIEVYIGWAVTSQKPEQSQTQGECYRIADPYTPLIHRLPFWYVLDFIYSHRIPKKIARFIYRVEYDEVNGKHFQKRCLFKIPVSRREV